MNKHDMIDKLQLLRDHCEDFGSDDVATGQLADTLSLIADIFEGHFQRHDDQHDRPEPHPNTMLCRAYQDHIINSRQLHQLAATFDRTVHDQPEPMGPPADLKGAQMWHTAQDLRQQADSLERAARSRPTYVDPLARARAALTTIEEGA